MIFANEFYGKLRKIAPTCQDIPQVKNDLLNIRSIISLLDIESDCIIELIDSSKEQVDKEMKALRIKIEGQAK